MPVTISVLDETTSGERHSAGDFKLESEALTLRELIRLRVQQEIERFNSREFEEFRGLVQPEELQCVLNGVRERPMLNWEKQFDRATAAFRSNGFLVFVDDCQVMDLDQVIHITPESKVNFLKLVPLIGG